MAAEAVCPDEGVGREDVAELLLRLVDQSLVVAEESAEGATRYRLLEPLRQYAGERLAASGEAEALRCRHAAAYLALAEAAEPGLRGPRQLAWFARLEREQGNLRTALGRLTERGGDGDAAAAQHALRLGGALWWFWRWRGHWSEGRQWLERAVALPAAGAPSAARAKALHGLGRLVWGKDDVPDARPLLEESLALARALGDQARIAAVLPDLGWVVAHPGGDVAAARALFEEGLARCRDLGDRWGMAWTLYGLGDLTIPADPVEGRRCYEESMAQYQETEAQSGLAEREAVTARLEGQMMAAEDAITAALTALAPDAPRQW